MQLLLHGERRGIAIHYTDKDGYLQAIVREAEEMLPLNPEDPAFVALHREARARAAELGQKSGLPDEVVQQVLAGVNEAGQVRRPRRRLHRHHVRRSARCCSRRSASRSGSRRVLVHVQRQIGVLDAQEDIKSQVQEELGERQREMFLREQLKTIQRELGEDDERDDLQELKEKLAALELPAGGAEGSGPGARAGSPGSAASPWNRRSSGPSSRTSSSCRGTRAARSISTLPEAQRILDEDHYALGDVKDRVLEFLAVRQLRMQQDAAERPRTDEPADGRGEAGEGGRRRTSPRTRPRPPRPCPRPTFPYRATTTIALAVRSCCSSVLRASARPRSPSRSPARWGGSTSASRWAARGTRPTFAVTAAPTSAPCPAASSRG